MSAIELVKAFEGFHRVVQRAPVIMAAPYICPAGYWTICWGHLCGQDHPMAAETLGEAYLADDLAMAEVAVRSLILAPMTNGQRDALTSWTFNLGPGRLRSSTLRAVLNRKEYDRAPAEMRRWVYAAGRPLAGLVARREAEVAMFLS